MANLESNIESNAQGPKKATTDAGTVEQHSLKDQMEADAYLKSAAASRGQKRGFSITRLKPPGTI